MRRQESEQQQRDDADRHPDPAEQPGGNAIRQPARQRRDDHVGQRPRRDAAPTIAALNPNSCVSRNGVDSSKVIDAMKAVYAPIADSASTGRASRSIGRIGLASPRSRRTK